MKAVRKERMPLESRDPGIARNIFVAEAKMHEQKLLQTICDLTYNFAQAEDTLEDLFVNLFRHLSEDRGKSALFPWLLQTATDLSIESLLHENFSDASRVCDPSLLASRLPSASTALSKALISLPEELQDVVRWRDLYGFSLEEVADILLTSPFEVQAKSYRAHLLINKSLPELLAPQEELIVGPTAAEL